MTNWTEKGWTENEWEAWIEAVGCDPRCVPKAKFLPDWTVTEWAPGQRVPIALTPPHEIWPALLPNRLGRNTTLVGVDRTRYFEHYFRPCQNSMDREEVARALTSALAQHLAVSLRGAGLAAYVRNGAVVTGENSRG